jgi:hypothetical protein
MSKKNEGNITVYYDNGPRMTIWLRPNLRSRLRLIRHALFMPNIFDAELSHDEVRWLFGRLGKVLRAMKRDQANA